MARVLIVDDQPEILTMLESLLVQMGHHVVSAKDGYDAVDKIKNQPFEMVITDVTMPGGLNGFDVVRTIRSSEKTEDILIILLTSKREKRDVEKGIQAGVDDYCVKPIDPDLFLAKVTALLSKSNRKNTEFPECAISEEATLLNTMRIKGVSEVGISIQSSHPLHVGTKLRVNSTFFEKVGVDSPMLRVMSCELQANQFTIRMQYVGVTESFLQPLRVWIRNRSASSAA